MVRGLVDAGADITLRGRPSTTPVYDKTALELAEQMKHTRCAEELQRAIQSMKTAPNLSGEAVV